MADERARRKKAVPRNYEGIVNLITAEYPGLSTGYQQVARYFTQNPNVIALESINAIAAKCGVHPSSLVRFAQNLGYTGFKHLQSVFQTRLATAAPGFR
jgi:DNA-binding MurR/RpiR family transcriptional regulator